MSRGQPHGLLHGGRPERFDRGLESAEGGGGLQDRPPHRGGRREVAVVRIHRNPKPGTDTAEGGPSPPRRADRDVRARGYQDRQGEGQVLDAAGHRARLDPFAGKD